MKLVPFAACLALSGCSPKVGPSGLLPDLNMSLDCSQGISMADELTIERSLFSVGFDVLDRARLARELRVDFAPPLMINAIDRKGRMVSVTGFGEPRFARSKGSIRDLDISLYSHPPTSRDANLERKLANIATAIPKCSVRKVERHSNPASIEWLYKDIAKQVRGWFGQAQQQAPASDTHRVH